MTHGPTNDSLRRRLLGHAGPLLIIALAIGAAYASSWSATFGFMDDYNLVNNSAHGNIRILWTCIEQGRPLDGVILELVSRQIHHVATLSHARGVAQLFIVIAAFIFYAAMVRSGWPRALAAVLAVVCGTLPAMQVYAVWAVEVGQPLAVAAAGAAALLATSSGENGIASPRRWLLRVSAGASLLAALLIYQPAAMAFWVFVAIDLFRPGLAKLDTAESAAARTRLGRGLLRYVLVAAVALAAAGIAVWWGLHYQIAPVFHHDESAGQRATLVRPRDVLDKWNFFCHQVMPMALNLTNIDTQKSVAIAVALLIATGLPLFVWMTSGRWELLALAAVLTPLCYLPNLAVTGDWPAFRTQAAIESLMAFYALLSMQAWWWLGCRVLLAPSGLGARPWLSSRLMAVLAGSSVLAAGYFVTVYFVVPQTIEYRLAQSLLKDAKLSGASRVELIGADWSDTAAPAVYFEEFGQPSSYRPWGGVPMIHLLLAERHPAYRDLPVDFVTPGTGDLPSAAGSIIMDMRQLRTFRNVVGE